jgi:predicted O-methyltransferase YrrM
VKKLLRNLAGAALAHASPDLQGKVDFLLRPSLRAAWGGPLNGQEYRRSIVRALVRAIDFDLVIETGTFRGTSTEFFSAVFGTPVETVELDPRLASYSRQRLAFDPKITVSLGDSRPFLRRLAEDRGHLTTFVYLDAHWSQDLPLREELAIVRDSWNRAVVMIDDFEVPDAAGYGYDDYGPGKALTASLLPDMPGWQLLYPAAPSHEETGARRGCAVLLSPALAGVDVKELRTAGTTAGSAPAGHRGSADRGDESAKEVPRPAQPC